MSNEPTRAYCIYNLCREKYIGLHEHESETGRITTHALGHCDRGEHPTPASSRFLDLDALQTVEQLAAALRTDPVQDAVRRWMPTDQTHHVAAAILAALRRESGDTR